MSGGGRREENHLEALFLAGVLPTTYLAPDGTILRVNERGAANLGCTPAALCGASIFDHLPDMAEELRGRLKQVVAARTTLDFVDEVSLPGGRRVFESHNTPIFDDDGRCLGIQVVSRDVTDSRRGEAALQQARERLAASERRFNLAMEAVRDGVWDWNVATGDFEMSPNFFALVGYTEDELDEGRLDWFYGVLHPDDQPRIQALLEAHFAGETEEYVAQYRWKHKNGTWRWALARGRVVERGDDGSPIRMVGTTIDVTDRHVLEARLLAAEKMEAVGRLAGGVAHDFNNLLTAVIAHLEFLRAYELPDGALEDVAQIDMAISHASRLTTQLLAFARRKMVQPKPVDVNALIQELQALVGGLLGADIATVLSLGEGLPQVYLDPAQAEQIIINLALNARDAMPEGGRLSIATSLVELDDEANRGETAPGPHVRVVVTDTGHGMDAQTLQHVFEPFFTTKPVGEGTGLGLASCYGIVKQAGGDIHVESKPGEGARFVIDLPVYRGAKARRAEGESGARILIVEDDERVRNVAVRSLETHYEVTQAASGDQALALARQAGGFDLLVTDVVMPGMRGTTLAERMTARHPGLKVLFMSGYAHDAIARHGLLAGGAPLLAKPFSPSTLLAKVRELLEDDPEA